MARTFFVAVSIALVSASCVSSTEPASDDGWIDETGSTHTEEPSDNQPDEPGVEHRRAGGIILPAGTFSFMPPDKRVWLHTQAEARDPSGTVGIRILHDEMRNERWPLRLNVAPFVGRHRAAVEHRNQWSSGASYDLYAGVGAPFFFDGYVHLFQCRGGLGGAAIWDFDNLLVHCAPGLRHLTFYFKPDPTSPAAADEPAISNKYLQWFRRIRQTTREYSYRPERRVPIKIYAYIRDHDTAYWSKSALASIHGFEFGPAADSDPWSISTACLPNFCVPRDQE